MFKVIPLWLYCLNLGFLHCLRLFPKKAFECVGHLTWGPLGINLSKQKFALFILEKSSSHCLRCIASFLKYMPKKPVKAFAFAYMLVSRSTSKTVTSDPFYFGEKKRFSKRMLSSAHLTWLAASLPVCIIKLYCSCG